MDKIRSLQDRFIGNGEGLRELERFLTQRETALRDAVEESKRVQDEQHSS